VVEVVALEARLSFNLPSFIISAGRNLIITNIITRDEIAHYLVTLTVYVDIAALSANIFNFEAGTYFA
jgi:hypothetical protein